MTTNELQRAFEQAERDAQKVMAEKDAALERVQARYGDKLREATERAAQAQAAWREAVVVDALRDRPDGEALAARFGITLEGR